MSQILVVGNVNLDLILGTQAPWPSPGTEVTLEHRDLRPGGQAGNVALALQALEVPFTLLGNRGNDALGDWLQKAFAGISVHWTVCDAPTALSVGITHPNRDRTFFTHLGHLETLTSAQLRPGLVSAQPGEVLLLLGAFLSPKLRVEYPSLLELARGLGLTIAIDPGWPPEGWESCRAEVLGWFAQADHILINELEAMGLSDTNNLEAAISWLKTALPETTAVVIKCGSEGAIGWQRSNRVKVPAPTIEAIDTIGAGDTFNAGYLGAWLEGKNLSKCIEAGVVTASYAISTFPRKYRPTSPKAL